MMIRPCVLPDRSKILHILQATKAFNNTELGVALEVFDDALKGDDYTCVCAVDGSETLTGYICFGLIPMTDASYDLYWIAVDPTCEKRGIGGELLRYAEAAVARQGGRHIYIETSSTEPYGKARYFYMKHGYTVASIFEDFYRIGDNKITFTKKISTGSRDAAVRET
jgi:ribosomal protein S18 acetylase RimI-like enzyme